MRYLFPSSLRGLVNSLQSFLFQTPINHIDIFIVADDPSNELEDFRMTCIDPLLNTVDCEYSSDSLKTIETPICNLSNCQSSPLYSYACFRLDISSFNTDTLFQINTYNNGNQSIAISLNGQASSNLSHGGNNDSQ